MSKSRLTSGRVIKSSKENLDPRRNEFLDLANAEPDLGAPAEDGSILVSDIDGTREWTKELNVDITGDVTGNVTGDVTGNVTGDVTGNLLGDVTGNLLGDVTGNVTGNLLGDVTGDVTTDSIVSNTGSISIESIGENGSINLIPTGVGTVDVSNFKITSLQNPEISSDAANKAYVDEVAQGLKVRQSAWVLADANLAATYNPDGAEVGWATLTASSNGAFPEIDEVDSAEINVIGARILVIAQTNPAHNGLYVLIDIGSELTPWVLRRCKSCKTNEQIPGSFVFVQKGTIYSTTGWVAVVDDPLTFTVGVDSINWTQFSGVGTFLAGSGLALDGNVFSVVESLITDKAQLVAGIIEPEDLLLVYDTSSGELRQSKISDVALAGARGDTGFTGSQGDVGFTGSAGADGVIGVDGAQGAVGFTGSQGDVGFTGSQGVVGFTGSQGDVGFTGSQGDIGLEPWKVINSDYTASNRDRLIANGTTGSFNITLPLTPSVGDYIQITDGANFNLYPITILRNGNTIEGFSENVLLDLSASTFEFIYDGTTWHITSTTGPQGFTGSAGAGFTGSQGEPGIPGEFAAVGFTGSAGAGFTGSQGDIGFTGSVGSTGDTGYTGSRGANGNRSVMLAQEGLLVARTGTARWYAPAMLTITNIIFRLAEPADQTATIVINKNGTATRTINMTAGQLKSTNNSEFSMQEDDYLTVDVTSAGSPGISTQGSGLTVTFLYIFTD